MKVRQTFSFAVPKANQRKSGHYRFRPRGLAATELAKDGYAVTVLKLLK